MSTSILVSFSRKLSGGEGTLRSSLLVPLPVWTKDPVKSLQHWVHTKKTDDGKFMKQEVTLKKIIVGANMALLIDFENICVCLFVCQKTLFNQGDKFIMGRFCVGRIWANFVMDRICHG